MLAFINRRRNQVKLLMWTRGGFTIVQAWINDRIRTIGRSVIMFGRY